jgi:hydrogenase expression/formation protein HypC
MTTMCLAIPGKVVSTDGSIAIIDFGGVQRETNISLVEVKPGDYVVVHAGFAIQVVDELDAMETLRLWEELLASQEES